MQWRSDIKRIAAEAKSIDAPLWDFPIEAHFSFHFSRPLSHWGTGRNRSKLKPSAPRFMVSTPDLLKVARAVEDALSGVIYTDDRQIVRETLEKAYADGNDIPGVWIDLKESAFIYCVPEGE